MTDNATQTTTRYRVAIRIKTVESGLVTDAAFAVKAMDVNEARIAGLRIARSWHGEGRGMGVEYMATSVTVADNGTLMLSDVVEIQNVDSVSKREAGQTGTVRMVTVFGSVWLSLIDATGADYVTGPFQRSEVALIAE